MKKKISGHLGKVAVREIPIDCGTPELKTRWFKYIDTLVKTFKLTKNNTMFTEYQFNMTERIIAFVKAAGAFLTNNNEFIRRCVSQQTKTDWMEVVIPFIDPFIHLIGEYVMVTRDGTLRSAEDVVGLLNPVEKLITNMINRWARFTDKGHGPEVDKMSQNLENLESHIHRLENEICKFVSDQKQAIMDKEKDAEKKKQEAEVRKQEYEKMKQQQAILIQQQEKEAKINNKPPPPPQFKNELDREIYEQKNKYKGVNDDDPNASILKSLLDLNNL